MRTTLRFASVVGGVGGLVLLAAVILSASDWISTSPGIDHRIAVHTSAPPSTSAPTAQGPTPASASQPAVDLGPHTGPAAAVPPPPPHGPVALGATGPAPGGAAVVSRAGAGESSAGQHEDDRGNDGDHDHGGGHGGDHGRGHGRG